MCTFISVCKYELKNKQKKYYSIFKKNCILFFLIAGQFVEMRNCQGTYYVVVIEDLSKSIIVGTCMLVIERKFIHSCGSRARLEDLVVDTAYRGKQLGKLLIEVTRQLAWNLGCYKVSLECKDELISYYEQFGFNKEIGNGNFLVQRQY
ncbi:hypothetical protein TPS_07130 [Trichinella pseudospiralis]